MLTPTEAERGRYHPRGGGNVELLYIKPGTARRDEVLRQVPECLDIGKGRVGTRLVAAAGLMDIWA